MIVLALFWFLTGVLVTAACFAVIGPLLRAKVPWQVALCAGVMLVLVLALYWWLGRPDLISQPASTADSNSSLGSAAPTAPAPTAGSMSSAIASLEARLAKGGGSAEDWELLAKSYDFQGRPADASGARSRRLPQDSAAHRSGITVGGEVSLAAALSAKARPGATLFIIAKSVDSPGAPVAVLRASVGTWPVKFTLDDSQSMLPGRNLSSAGRVTIEARISQTGQPQPAAGDLQGASGVIDPAGQVALKILIDRTIP